MISNSACPTGVVADRPLSYAKVEALASRFRKQLGYDPSTRIDGEKLFERLHELQLTTALGLIPVESGVDSLEPPTEGLTKYNPDKERIEILLSEETYKGLLNCHPHCLYCLGHEIGHCVLHTAQLKRLAKLPPSSQIAFHRGRKLHEAYIDTEWQANAFASAFLMPARGIAALERVHSNFLSSKVANTYGVSAEAASYRLQCYNSRKAVLLAVN